MIRLYGIPNCNKIRNTRNLFGEIGIEYEFINVRKTPVTEDKLKTIVSKLGIDTLFNTKGTTYRRLNLDYKKMDQNDKFQVLFKEQSMIKRPLIEKDGEYHVGFDELAIKSFIG